jgi:DNA-binding MarR family transcriptional regulator
MHAVSPVKRPSSASSSASADGAPRAVKTFYKPRDYRSEESIGHLMRRIMIAMIRSMESHMAESGTTYPQWIPLHKLHIGQAATVAELARGCDLDTGAMTRLLDRLEAKGLCRRVRSVSDRRVVNIEITDEGREAAKQAPPLICRVQNELLAGFSDEEWEQLKSYLRRMLDNAQVFAPHKEKNDPSSS